MLHIVQAIILAAGKSQRFKNDKTKLLEPICGQPMILYQTHLLDHLGVSTALVVGYQKEAIQKVILEQHSAQKFSFVEQFEQKGTGDALRCTRHLWKKDHILIMNGDVPLITEEILSNLYSVHIASDAAITFVTAHDNFDSGYGRVVKSGNTIEIVEAVDFNNLSSAEICSVNAGIYLFKRTFLLDFIDKIIPHRFTDEYYITDLIKLASEHGLRVETFDASFDRVRGINNQEELWIAEQIKRADLIKHWMSHGVRFMAAQNTYLDVGVTIGKGTVIGAGVHLLGTTQIGEHAVVGPFSILSNAVLENKAIIKPHSVVEDSLICQDASVGPFAYCRGNTVIGSQSIIGAFVECKKSSLGTASKAKHLSYIGDASIGNSVNIGGGTIIANHDGFAKHQTVIKDRAYIGANSSLVAPLIVAEDVFVAAGSTITQDIDQGALAIARARQINKPDYAYKLKMKKSAHVMPAEVVIERDNSSSESMV